MPAGTYRTANVALNAFSTDEHQAEDDDSPAFGEPGNRHLGRRAFRSQGADLINGVGLDPMIFNTVDPAWLFTYGTFLRRVPGERHRGGRGAR